MRNKEVVYTSISELIEQLLEVKEQLGDLPVCFNGASPVYLNTRPFYYDGGYVLQDAQNPKNYKRSRSQNTKGLTVKTEGFPDACVDILGLNPDDYLTLDNRSVREIDPESWEYLEQKEQEERNFFNGQIVRYKNDGVFDNAFGCCPYTAYLDSGESALGGCMRDARNNLKEIYLKLS